MYVGPNKRDFVYLTRNITCMKKKLLYAAAFILVAWSFNSCSALSNCKMCKFVEYENGSVISSGSETEYCGAELIAHEAIPDATTGSITTKVECH
jgi:hypothetical protein